MKPLYIDAISLHGPGLPGWSASIPILQAPEQYDQAAVPPLQSTFLTSQVKRRTTPHMHLAIFAAEKALEGTGVDYSGIELVFASSQGDLNVAHHLLYALTLESKPLSPLKFQNVILNAAAGHLGILLKNTASATTVTAEANTLAVGLLQSYATAMVEELPILYVAYDAPAIIKVRPDAPPIDPFAVGFLLSPEQTERSVASIRLDLEEGGTTTAMDDPVLSEVSKRSSAAGSLPMLMALAKRQRTKVSLPYSRNQTLNVEIAPC